MSIIIPAGIDQTNIRVPMEFPLRPDADTVLDANGRVVLTMDDSIDIGESIKFAKLFAQAPNMWQLLGHMYVMIGVLAKENGLDHGTEEEQDKDKCLLCRAEKILDSIK